MKIKRSKLRKIINEEIKRCLVEQASDKKRTEKEKADAKETLADLEAQSAQNSEESAKASKEKEAKLRDDAAKHDAAAAKMTESDSGHLDEIIKKLANGKYRLYSKKKNPKTGKRRNLGTFDSPEAAEKHERHVKRFSEWKNER